MEPFIEASVQIEASTQQVWDALINPEKTRRYMFGCDIISDWKPGSQVLWKGNMDGKELILVKGSLIRIVEEKLLEFTVFDPNGNLEDMPSNYLTVTYQLNLGKQNQATILSVRQGDYTQVEEGEKRYQETKDSWGDTLERLKKTVEPEHLNS